MTIELVGRIPSKKNSRRVVRNSGRTLVLTSKAYETWQKEWTYKLRTKRPKTPLHGSLALTLHLYLKGRIDQDLDNAVSSVLDLLQDTGIIENDKDVMELHLYKHPGNPDFAATVELSQA